MADVSLRVGIEGSQEAQKAIEDITKVIVEELGAEIQRQESLGKTTAATEALGNITSATAERIGASSQEAQKAIEEITKVVLEEADAHSRLQEASGNATLATVAQTAATEELKDEELSFAEIQERLNKIAEEYQQKLAAVTAAKKKQTEGTEELKKRTQELVRRFEEQNQKTKDAQHVFSNLADELKKTIIQYAAAAVGITAVVSTIKEAFSAGREAELTFIKLGAILEATGHSAGFTASQLGDLSDKLAKGTRFDNTGIQQAMTILLTFGSVQGEVFESALRHAQNLSEMYGIGLPQAARMMGQALSDPGQGLGRLRQYVGPLNEDLKALIKNLDETGRTAEARQEIIKLLDGKFKDFAHTIGTSTPAAFDRMKLAWGNLLQELGKTTPLTALWEALTKSLDNWRKVIEGYERWRKENTMRMITDELATVEAGSARWLELNKKMQELQRQEREKQEQLEQESRDAALAAAKAGWDEEAADKKRAAEKAAEENKKLYAKDEQERQANILRQFEQNELEIKAGKMTWDSRELLLEAFLANEKKGTDIYIRLSKLRDEASAELMKQAEQRQDKALALMDLEIARGLNSYEQKIIMLDSWIAREESGTEKWIELMMLRQRTLDDIQQRDDKRAQEQEKRDEDHARDIKHQADEEIMAIRRASASNNEKLAALDKLALKYYNMEKAGVDAYEAVQKAIRNTETEEERRAKRVQNIMESMRLNVSNLSTEEEKRFRRIVSVLDGIGVDIVSIFGSIESSWGSSIKGMMDGSMSFSEGIKSMWKGIVDAIIEEIARMVARWLAAQAVMGFFQLAGFALGVATGNPAGAVTAGAFSAGGGFASGGDLVVTRPTAILAGEAGAERISVTPLSGGASSRPAVVNVFQGPNVMDQFSLRRFVRDQQRIMRSEIARRG